MGRRRRPLPTCSYCDDPGLGDPPLCRVHYDEVFSETAEAPYQGDVDVAVRDFLGHVMSHPRVAAFISKMQGNVDTLLNAKFYQGPGRGYAATWPPPPGGARPGPAPPPPPGGGGATGGQGQRQQRPPPPPRPRVKLEDPRVVLGFPSDKALSQAEIKQRQRALAAMFHPDVGGSHEAMQRVNTAAEALLSEL